MDVVAPERSEFPEKVSAHIKKVASAPNPEFTSVLDPGFSFKDISLFARLFDANGGAVEASAIDFGAVYQPFHHPEASATHPNLIAQYWDWVARNLEAVVPLFSESGPDSLRQKMLDGFLEARRVSLAEEGLSDAALNDDASQFREQFNTAWDAGALQSAILKALVVNLTSSFASSSLCIDRTLPDADVMVYVNNNLASAVWPGDEKFGGIPNQHGLHWPKNITEAAAYAVSCREAAVYHAAASADAGFKVLMGKGAIFQGGYMPTPGTPVETMALHLNNPADISDVLPLIDLEHFDAETFLSGIGKARLNAIVDQLLDRLDLAEPQHVAFLNKLITTAEASMTAQAGSVYDVFRPRNFGFGAPHLEGGALSSKTLKIALDTLHAAIAAHDVVTVKVAEPPSAAPASLFKFYGSTDSDADSVISTGCVGEPELAGVETATDAMRALEALVSRSSTTKADVADLLRGISERLADDSERIKFFDSLADNDPLKNALSGSSGPAASVQTATTLTLPKAVGARAWSTEPPAVTA